VFFLGLTVKGQEGSFSAGANLGLPIGDASNVYSFVLGAEINYLFEISDGFKVGPSVSFINFFSKSVEGIEVPNANFLPIAAAGRFSISEEFTL